MIEIKVNGQPMQVATETTVAELLFQLDLAGKRLAVEYNKEILPRSLHTDTALQSRDRIEIVEAIGGG